MIQAFQALHEGDEAKLFAAVEATEPQKEFFRTFIQFSSAVRDFRDAFVKTYGDQAWRDFQDDNKAPKDGNAKLTINDPQEQIAKTQKLQFEERGDEAFCPSIDGSGTKVRFIRVKDGWRIEGRSNTPPEEGMKQTLVQIRQLTEALRKYQKAIGKPGIKGEDIDAELGREIVKILRNVETNTPHRFDINKL